MYFLKPLLFLSFLVLFCHKNHAQISSEDFFHQYQEIIREKIRVDLNQWPKNYDQSDFQGDNNSFYRSLGNEKQITTSSIPESEVHAVINPNDSNNIVLAPIRLQQMGGFTLPVYYSKDFGKTWYQSSWKASPPSSSALLLGGGDPVFVFDADGKLYFSWIHLFMEGSNSYTWALLWAYSEDQGTTWKTNGNYTIVSSTGSSIYTLPIIADKQWMAVDRSLSPFRNTLYVAYLKADMTNQQMRIVVSRKPADSASFLPSPVEVSNGDFAEVQFAQCVVDNNGYVHVTFYGSYDKSTYSLFHSVSRDGGKTFSTPIKITNIIKLTDLTGINTKRLYPAPALAVDNSNSPYSGRLYLTFTALGTNSDNGTASDIYLTWSSDTGQTWSTPVIVNDDDKQHLSEQFYSSIHVNPDGIISLSWYDGRHSTFASSNEIVQYYVAHSFDGGATFTPNYNVSSSFTDFQTVGDKNNQFGIGEYNQILSTSGYCIPVWSDGRKGDGDLDIYIAITEIQKNPANIREIKTLSSSFAAGELYPNPCTNFCSFSLMTEKNTEVNIAIYHTSGKRISTVLNKKLPSGTHQIDVDCRKIPAGIYYLTIETPDDIISKRLIINR